MSTVRTALAYTALDSYVGAALQLVSTVVIARILTPEQTGIFAVAAVFAALASTFRDFGVGEYLIQEKSLDDDCIRAALSVNIAISWLMAALLFFLAPVAAGFYRTQGVADVMRVQSVNFLLIPFGAVTMAWFRRELDFRRIFIVNILGNVALFGVGVSMALAGFSYMSLAWASLAGVVTTVVLSLFMRPRGFPRWPGSKGVGRVLHFGKFASGIYIFGQAGRGAPELIIGRAQGMAAAGLFSRAYGLVEIFNRLVLRAVMPVCLPYFSRAIREQGTALRGFLTSISYLTAIGWTFLFFMAVCAFPVVRILYGVQWLEAVPLARLLCIVAAIELIYYPAKEALLAQGLAKQSNALQMIIQSLRVAGLLAAIPFGLPGACWGLMIGTALGAVASHRYLGQALGLRWRDTLTALWPSLVVAGLAVFPLAAWVVLMPVGESNYWQTAIVGSGVTAALWLLVVRQFSHPLWPEVGKLMTSTVRRIRMMRGQGL
jgi:O-antigen/teichoic acid export membrane protein